MAPHLCHLRKVAVGVVDKTLRGRAERRGAVLVAAVTPATGKPLGVFAGNSRLALRAACPTVTVNTTRRNACNESLTQ